MVWFDLFSKRRREVGLHLCFSLHVFLDGIHCSNYDEILFLWFSEFLCGTMIMPSFFLFSFLFDLPILNYFLGLCFLWRKCFGLSRSPQIEQVLKVKLMLLSDSIGWLSGRGCVFVPVKHLLWCIYEQPSMLSRNHIDFDFDIVVLSLQWGFDLRKIETVSRRLSPNCHCCYRLFWFSSPTISF